LPEAFMKPMAAGDEGIAAGRGLPGDSRLFAFARLSPPWQDFWVTIGLQRDWAISPVNRILWRNLMFLGLVALLSMAAAWYGGKFFIVRPVMKLLTVVERLASGDLSVRAGPDYQVGELGLLAQSFDHMADSLKEREEALRQAHDELEERVAERTAILRLTNEQLVWEIEERQRVEDRLRESEAHFAAFMEHLPGLAVMRDMEGRYLFANHAWEELMGLEPGAWQGKTLAELWPLEQATNFQKLDFEIISSRRPMEQVEILEQEDGPHYYLSKRFPITDKNDLPYMVGGISIDVTDRQRAEAALKGSKEKLRYLAEQLLTAQENERKRLAAALHDELGHALLALKLHLSSIAKKIGTEQKELQEGVLAQLDHINEVIQEVRRLYYDLSPGDVEDLGLTKALRTLIREFAGHVPQVTWQVDLADLQGLFSLPVQTIIYRTMQEALTNIGKHAHPTLVTISSKKEPSQVNFVVQDNGIGFDPQELGSRGSGRGVGLVAMEERLNMIGGSFEIHSRDQEGTRLSFTIPILQEGDKP
jgi:PAS domain S-box-containing protein